MFISTDDATLRIDQITAVLYNDGEITLFFENKMSYSEPATREEFEVFRETLLTIAGSIDE